MGVLKMLRDYREQQKSIVWLMGRYEALLTRLQEQERNVQKLVEAIDAGRNGLSGQKERSPFMDANGFYSYDEGVKRMHKGRTVYEEMGVAGLEEDTAGEG